MQGPCQNARDANSYFFNTLDDPSSRFAVNSAGSVTAHDSLDRQGTASKIREIDG